MGNPIKPGKEGGLPLEPWKRLPRLEKDVLREVPGIRVIAHQVENEAVNFPAVARDQGVESSVVAAAGFVRQECCPGFHRGLAASWRRLTFGRGHRPIYSCRPHPNARGARGPASGRTGLNLLSWPATVGRAFDDQPEQPGSTTKTLRTVRYPGVQPRYRLVRTSSRASASREVIRSAVKNLAGHSRPGDSAPDSCRRPRRDRRAPGRRFGSSWISTSRTLRSRKGRPGRCSNRTFRGVGKVIAIASGKGGVGKATVASNLAVAWPAPGRAWDCAIATSTGRAWG